MKALIAIAVFLILCMVAGAIYANLHPKDFDDTDWDRED